MLNFKFQAKAQGQRDDATLAVHPAVASILGSRDGVSSWRKAKVSFIIDVTIYDVE
jgi:hypothetical protein